METTIIKRVKGSTMEKLFDNPEIINIRYFKAKIDFDKIKYNENSSYFYELKIRHNENEDAEILFENAVKKVNLCQ